MINFRLRPPNASSHPQVQVFRRELHTHIPSFTPQVRIKFLSYIKKKKKEVTSKCRKMIQFSTQYSLKEMLVETNSSSRILCDQLISYKLYVSICHCCFSLRLAFTMGTRTIVLQFISTLGMVEIVKALLPRKIIYIFYIMANLVINLIP